MLKTDHGLDGDSLSYLDMMERNTQVTIITITNIINVIFIIFIAKFTSRLPPSPLSSSLSSNVIINKLLQEEQRRARERQLMDEGR